MMQPAIHNPAGRDRPSVICRAQLHSLSVVTSKRKAKNKEGIINLHAVAQIFSKNALDMQKMLYLGIVCLQIVPPLHWNQN